MTHPPGTRLGSMRPGPTQPTRTGSHASAATHRQLEEAHLPRRSPHGKTEQGFPARETLTRGYSQREGVGLLRSIQCTWNIGGARSAPKQNLATLKVDTRSRN